jgi:hypothetical protein
MPAQVGIHELPSCSKKIADPGPGQHDVGAVPVGQFFGDWYAGIKLDLVDRA